MFIAVNYTPMLHKQHGKKWLIVRYYTRYRDEHPIFWISLFVNSKDGVDFAMLFTLWASLFELRPNTTGKPEDFRSCVVKGSR